MDVFSKYVDRIHKIRINRRLLLFFLLIGTLPFYRSCSVTQIGYPIPVAYNGQIVLWGALTAIVVFSLILFIVLKKRLISERISYGISILIAYLLFYDVIFIIQWFLIIFVAPNLLDNDLRGNLLNWFLYFIVWPLIFPGYVGITNINESFPASDVIFGVILSFLFCVGFFRRLRKHKDEILLVFLLVLFALGIAVSLYLRSIKISGAW